jgi:hypothetical protein
MKLLSLLLMCLFVYGCAGAPKEHDNLNKLIEGQEWESAYKMLELGLISPREKDRQQAFAMVEKYPEIRDGARQSFSKKALMEKYKLYGKMAYTVEAYRLQYYKQSIATPEEYAQAEQNVNEVLGDVYEEKVRVESEINSAIDPHRQQTSWMVSSLMEMLSNRHATRMELISVLGRPSRVFELGGVLTWWLTVKDGTCLVSSERTDVTTHSLVLVFDQTAILVKHAMVEIIGNGGPAH